MDPLQAALDERRARETWPHPNYYKPFDAATSRLLRDHYRSRLLLPEQGDGRALHLQSGLQLSNGYTRVVVGDYGAYVEISPEQLIQSSVRDRFGNRRTPKRRIKYWWMVPTDGSVAKVYEQVRTVAYADYKPGMFYIAPDDLQPGQAPTGVRSLQMKLSTP